MGAGWSLGRSLSGDFEKYRDGVRWIAWLRLRRPLWHTYSHLPHSSFSITPCHSLVVLSHAMQLMQVTAWYSLYCSGLSSRQTEPPSHHARLTLLLNEVFFPSLPFPFDLRSSAPNRAAEPSRVVSCPLSSSLQYLSPSLARPHRATMDVSNWGYCMCVYIYICRLVVSKSICTNHLNCRVSSMPSAAHTRHHWRQRSERTYDRVTLYGPL